MSFTTITLEPGEGGVATLWLDRPDKLNAVNPTMERELLEVFDVIDADDAIRAVVVTGRGRAFCAGADVSGDSAGFDVVRRSRERGVERMAPGDVPRDGGGMINLRMFACVKPLVAAINGAGVGYGATMPLPMDVRLAAEGARFGFVFSRRGMCLDGAASWFLPRLVGLSRALEWTMSGRIFDAAEALEGGLVRAVLPADELLDAAHAIARGMTSDSAPVSVALNRQLLWQMAGAAHPMDAHRAESTYILHRAGSADAEEGVKSLLEKRPAAFSVKVSAELPADFPWHDEPTFERRRH